MKESLSDNFLRQAWFNAVVNQNKTNGLGSGIWTHDLSQHIQTDFITYPKEQIWKDNLIVQIKRYVRRRRASIYMVLEIP